MATAAELTIKISAEPGALVPVYQTAGAAGADLSAYLPTGTIRIAPGERALIPTGLKMEIPSGYEVQVRPRSGLTIKHGLVVMNSPGTIDADYRGEVKVILANLGKEPIEIVHHMRIAQMVVAAAPQAAFLVSQEELSHTDRGVGGFGSTGH